MHHGFTPRALFSCLAQTEQSKCVHEWSFLSSDILVDFVQVKLGLTGQSGLCSLLFDGSSIFMANPISMPHLHQYPFAVNGCGWAIQKRLGEA